MATFIFGEYWWNWKGTWKWKYTLLNFKEENEEGNNKKSIISLHITKECFDKLPEFTWREVNERVQCKGIIEQISNIPEIKSVPTGMSTSVLGQYTDILRERTKKYTTEKNSVAQVVDDMNVKYFLKAPLAIHQHSLFAIKKIATMVVAKLKETPDVVIGSPISPISPISPAPIFGPTNVAYLIWITVIIATFIFGEYWWNWKGTWKWKYTLLNFKEENEEGNNKKSIISLHITKECFDKLPEFTWREVNERVQCGAYLVVCDGFIVSKGIIERINIPEIKSVPTGMSTSVLGQYTDILRERTKKYTTETNSVAQDIINGVELEEYEISSRGMLTITYALNIPDQGWKGEYGKIDNEMISNWLSSKSSKFVIDDEKVKGQVLYNLI
ncbi:9628_t:CDS:2 [Entrophospora sp. SA101]|nr:9628_t:CDS:2 [Entrophospora sp. SA101]